MFGRIFGRGRDEADKAVCASCGRTLLAGEWTQQITDESGDEKLICSLCAQARPAADGEPVRGTTTPANAGKVRETRSDSDAFWKALKDKDLEIERLQAQLARAEAEKQELLGRLARSEQAPTDEAPAGPAVADEAAESASQTAEIGAPQSSPPGGAAPELAAATWGETPDELAAALAEFDHPPEAAASGEHDEAPARAEGTEHAQADVPAVAFEDTQPIPAVGDELPQGPDEEPAASDRPEADDAEAGAPSTDETLAGEEADSAATTSGPSSEPETAAEAETPQERPVAPIAPLLAGEEQAEDAEQAAHEAQEAAEREAEAAASLTLLQRGVDLLNVSTVPRKIAETNEHLGLPSVHVGFDGQTVAVTFLWTMGWYRFAVDIDGGAVKLADRGYDERTDLQPNAGVRGDGTVHLAPAQISHAAAAKQAAQAEQPAEQPEARPTAERPAEAEPPSVAAQKAPEFISKSLLGQRSDDEPSPWDGAKARDFNWDR